MISQFTNFVGEVHNMPATETATFYVKKRYRHMICMRLLEQITKHQFTFYQNDISITVCKASFLNSHSRSSLYLQEVSTWTRN